MKLRNGDSSTFTRQEIPGAQHRFAGHSSATLTVRATAFEHRDVKNDVLYAFLLLRVGY